MQAHKPRCGSLETEQKISNDVLSKVLEQKPSMKNERLVVTRENEMQTQLYKLQDELKKVKEEWSRVSIELVEAKYGEERSKESERNMLESLMEQTKQLEQTKISLEEAKLGIRELEKCHGSIKEIGMLRNELKLATEAEDKSKSAMDDLAIALHEVTTDANRAKSEMQLAKAEAERLRVMLQVIEDKFRISAEESRELKLQLAESAIAWSAKENGFIDCMKVSEEEISKASREYDRLIDSQRLSREDNSKLRDILKQALSEATVVKEALEITRKENSQLKDQILENDNAFRKIKQDYECLKLSEAAAVGSVRELKELLAATSSVESKNVKDDEMKDTKKVLEFPSEHCKSENPEVRITRRHSVSGDVKSRGSIYDLEGTLERRNQVLQSTCYMSDSIVPSLFFRGHGSVSFDDFGHMERNQLTGMDQDPMKQKKKKPMMRRFGDMIRRRSFHK